MEERRSSATDYVTDVTDVTDGWMEERRRKKEESFLKLAMTNYQCPMLLGPITNSQFPIPKTNRARTARPIYQQLAKNYLLAELNFNHTVLFRFRFGQIQV